MCEVFGEVTAVVSTEAINIVEKSGDVLLILHKHIKSARPVHLVRGQNCQYSLIGSFDGVVAAKTELQDLIKTLQSDDPPVDSSSEIWDKQVFAPAENFHSSDLSDSKQGSQVSQQDTAESVLNIKSSRKRTHHSKKVTFKQSRSYQSSLKKDSRYPRRSRALDPDVLSKNLEKMKLSGTENSSDTEGRLHSDSTIERLSTIKIKSFESSVPYKFSCQICSFRTKRSSHFQKHLAIHDKLSALYKCSRCNFTTVRMGHLRRHEMTHSSTFHSCTLCSYRADDVKLLMRHMRIKHCKMHREKHGVVLKCQKCSYQTTLPRFLEMHQRFHCSKQGSKVYQCDKCCYKTHRKEHYTRHINSVHINERNHLCHLCGKAFKRADALQQHHQTHEESHDSNHNFKCNICEKVFKSYSHLSEHKAVHSEARLFLCEICGASFKTRSVQRKHITTIHKNPRSYSCHSCGKRFNTLYAMKRHQKVHLNSKIMPLRHVQFEPTEVSSFTSDSAEELKQSPAESSTNTLSSTTLKSTNVMSLDEGAGMNINGAHAIPENANITSLNAHGISAALNGANMTSLSADGANMSSLNVNSTNITLNMGGTNVASLNENSANMALLNGSGTSMAASLDVRGLNAASSECSNLTSAESANVSSLDASNFPTILASNNMVLDATFPVNETLTVDATISTPDVLLTIQPLQELVQPSSTILYFPSH